MNNEIFQNYGNSDRRISRQSLFCFGYMDDLRDYEPSNGIGLRVMNRNTKLQARSIDSFGWKTPRDEFESLNKLVE